MTTVVLAGATGLVGSHILTTLLAHPSTATIHAYARRTLPNPTSSPKLTPIASASPSTWPAAFPSTPHPDIFITALGTTRAAAGSLAAQRAVDLDLNLSLARAAHAAGVTVCVLVSSSNADAASRLAYPQMKGELEEGIKALGFRYTVILRPGLIQGERQESRPAEAVVRGLAAWMRRVSPRLTDWWVNDAGVIGRAAVRCGMECAEGRREEGVWEVGIGEIERLGREGEGERGKEGL